jgi:hypothetical protein
MPASLCPVSTHACRVLLAAVLLAAQEGAPTCWQAASNRPARDVICCRGSAPTVAVLAAAVPPAAAVLPAVLGAGEAAAGDAGCRGCAAAAGGVSCCANCSHAARQAVVGHMSTPSHSLCVLLCPSGAWLLISCTRSSTGVCPSC